MGKYQDLTGQKFGRLTVIKMAYRDKNRKYHWLCRCECGNEKIVYADSLRSGNTKSCGCLGKEHRTESLRKHDMTKTPIYRVWGNMKARCYIKSSSRYNRYGARGITVCDRWRDSIEAFYEDVSKLPHFGEKGYTLDRIDNNGNYEPSNVRWASKKEQMNNYSKNHYIEYEGKRQTIKQWSIETGINNGTIISRLKNGWSIERTLTEKAFRGKNGTFKGGDE